MSVHGKKLQKNWLHSTHIVWQRITSNIYVLLDTTNAIQWDFGHYSLTIPGLGFFSADVLTPLVSSSVSSRRILDAIGFLALFLLSRLLMLLVYCCCDSFQRILDAIGISCCHYFCQILDTIGFFFLAGVLTPLVSLCKFICPWTVACSFKLEPANATIVIYGKE